MNTSGRPKRLYGLIGYPLSHSFSKNFFSKKFEKEGLSDCEYELFPMRSLDELSALLRSQPELQGLNVTIPHKENIIPHLDEIDEAAQEIGAVNTIRISSGRLKGFNTDVFGFEKSLPDVFPEGMQALVLGTGGAAKAVAFVLKKRSIPFRMASRQPQNEELGYAEITPALLAQYRLVVNATPLGMFPNVNECPPLPYGAIHGKHWFYDLIYNPERTLFLKKAGDRGAQIFNGLEMLRLQAEQAWSIWNEFL